jgi:two-component system CheB/CheR fusion protein
MLPPPLQTLSNLAAHRALSTSRDTVLAIPDAQALGVGSVRVQPFVAGRGNERYLIITFERPVVTTGAPATPLSDEAAQHLAELERELAFVRESLQATIEELETSNEELQATNEELLSSNEELQSTNEELQSVNEELGTMNAEHQEKIHQLTRANEDLDNLFYATTMGTLFLDEQLCIRRFSQAATQQFSLLERDVGRPIEHITHHFRDFNLPLELRQVLTRAEVVEREAEATDGKRYLARLSPYLTEAGQVRGVLATFVDVTQLRSEQRARGHLQSVIDGLSEQVSVVGPDGVIRFVNTAWVRFAGENSCTGTCASCPRPERQGVGANYLEACRALPDVRRAIEEVLEGRRESSTVDYSCQASSGPQRWFVMTVGRLVNDSGVVISHVDVTQLRAIEAQRRIAGERLARVLKDSHDGVLFYDADTGQVAEVNDALAQQLGRPAAELMGLPLAALFPEPVRAAQLGRLAAAGQEPAAQHHLLLQLQGTEVREVEATLGQLHEGPRRLVALLLRDVSERKRLEAEREALARARYEAQKLEALGQLAAGVAHDINNVLTAILACASLEHGTPVEELREAMSEIHTAALSARDVTSRLGALSRKQPLRPTRFDLLQVLRSTGALLKRTLPPDVEVKLDLPPLSGFITGDEGEWHNAFLNLALNARDAMPGGGTLRLSARPQGPGLQVEVSDTGEGMTPEVLARAFEPFFTTKPIGTGTGLGLAHVHAVARAHGVEVQCHSSPGQGARFAFHFGAVELREHAATPGPSVARGPLGARVLLVDDDELARRATKRLLKQLKVDAIDVGSATTALELLQSDGGFQVLISDLLMPEMDGHELTLAVRARWPRLPVLIITGTVDDERRVKLVTAGANAVLGKPFKVEELRAHLEAFLGVEPKN